MGLVNVKREDIRDPFAAPPEGEYTIQCKHCELRESSKGDDMIEFRFDVVDGTVEDIEEHIGKEIRDYCVVSGESAQYGLHRYAQYCDALGLDTDAAEVDDFIGQQFEAFVGVQPADENFDSDRAQIKRIFSD